MQLLSVLHYVSQQESYVSVGRVGRAGNQACRAHLSSVAKFGGRPCINRPIWKRREANQSAPPAATMPTAIDSHTCHIGGGDVDVSRSSIAKAFIGGIKLTTVANSEFGSREIGNQNSHGIIISNVTGVISDCASRSSFTAEPIAAMSDPMMT